MNSIVRIISESSNMNRREFILLAAIGNKLLDILVDIQEEQPIIEQIIIFDRVLDADELGIIRNGLIYKEGLNDRLITVRLGV
jgi:hypothetical protein